MGKSVNCVKFAMHDTDVPFQTEPEDAGLLSFVGHGADGVFLLGQTAAARLVLHGVSGVCGGTFDSYVLCFC